MMAANEVCRLCDKLITADGSVITARGLENIIKISAELNDRVAEKLLLEKLPIPAHTQCKTNYTRPSNVRKRKNTGGESEENNWDKERKITCRSHVPMFNIKTDCVYCGENMNIDLQKKLNIDRREPQHEAETIELLSSITTKAVERDDAWGKNVHIRIQNVGDLVAASVLYHHNCQIRFHLNRPFESESIKGRPSGSFEDSKQKAFYKLCDHIDSNDTHQYSLSDLYALMQELSGDSEYYSDRHLRRKLQDHYGTRLIETKECGRETILTFLDNANEHFRESYKQTGLTADNIVDMAGTLIEDEIRSKHYDTHHFPKFSNLKNTSDMVSPLLLRLLSHLIKNTKSDRRVLSLSHAITSAARPRSFVSPILLAIAVYVNTKLESRELVDMLTNLSFADDYKEVLRLFDALLPDKEREYDWEGSLINFALDNADINIGTLTGHNSWHALGGIACQTPAVEHEEPLLPRSMKLKKSCDNGKFGEIPLKRYKKPAVSGLKQVFIGPLTPPDPAPLSLKLASKLDDMWLSSYFVNGIGLSPSWSGFNQTICTGTFELSKIDILPFVNNDPTKPETLYSALSFVQTATVKYKLGQVPVTFDQPLYNKAADIVASSPDLTNIFLRLGGFHFVMSYLGAIAQIMSESGLRNQWETVYASKSIDHMLTGHAYARSLRAHMISAASLIGHLLENTACMNEVTKEKIKSLHKKLLNHECRPEAISDEDAITQLSQIMMDLQKEEAESSRTGKLWVEYLGMVRVLLLFIRAERTGNWDLHLYSISKMIPILHAGGHIAYAKSSRLYLDQMKKLGERMEKEDFEKYTSSGYWTIRRSNRFWSGNFTDQTIEQVLMRMLKSRGGLAHGRGVTLSTQSKMVHIFPQTVPICESLEIFSGVQSSSSDQHKDLRPSSTARDGQHYQRFKNFLSQHSPFAYKGEHKDRLVCISTGVVAPMTANADRAIELGLVAANQITGKSFSEAKLKRNDKVISIGAAMNGTEVRGSHVEVDPMILFLRVTCVIGERKEMRAHLKHEFSKHPPSLFESTCMRKTVKSVLADVLKSYANPVCSNELQNPHYIIDGGHLLHTVKWPKEGTYGDVIDGYVAYVMNNYGQEAFICFDGYTDRSWSTKAAEQCRRTADNKTAPDILFELDMQVTCNQSHFLSNYKNKGRFVNALMLSLGNHGITCRQSRSDADFLICDSAIELAKDTCHPVVLVGKDTDLLVMLIDRSCSNLYMQFANNVIYNSEAIREALPLGVQNHLLIAHAITGCDTVSALFSVGKRSALEVLEKNDCSFLDIFQAADASHEQIAMAGERFVLKLYNAKEICPSLDDWRYLKYHQVMKQNKKKKTGLTSFRLESLPPTSAAMKYHSYRAYLTVQEWLGNPLLANDWGWESIDGMLSPICTDRPAATHSILRMVSCGCKTGCGKRCSCRKAGLDCSPMCSSCIGQSCSNACPIDDAI